MTLDKQSDEPGGQPRLAAGDGTAVEGGTAPQAAGERVVVRPPGVAPAVADGEERTVRMGREEPLPIRPLPEPAKAVHLLGPGMAVTALGVGLGETVLWPRLVIAFGPEVRWLFLIGVTIQLVVMMEMARWAMATGESIFFGAARLWRPVMWFFFLCALFIYAWPGHMAEGAQSLESLTDGVLPWFPMAIVGLVLIGVILTLAKIVYNLVENVLSVFVAILVIGSAIMGSMVGDLSDLGETLGGTVAFGYIPDAGRFFGDAWFPIVVGSIAFAGPSGMQQMWYTLWLRDKGAGMGAYIPRVRGLRGLDEEETMPSRGYTFDTEDPKEMAKWQGWRRWNIFDATVLFWGITMVTTIIFTVLALSAARSDPETATLIRDNESGNGDVVTAMASAFEDAGGDFARISFYLFIGIVGWKLSFGLFDALSRGQADMTFHFAGRTRRFGMSRLYLFYVWFIVAFGIFTLSIGSEEGPTAILDTLAFLSAFVMGAYCLLLLFTNNKLLPRKIRPGKLANLALAAGACLYLGGLSYSVLWLHAVP